MNMRPKADGILISKTRYLIPEKDGLNIELMYLRPQGWLYLCRSGIFFEEQALAIIHLYGLEKMLATQKYHNSHLSQRNL